MIGPAFRSLAILSRVPLSAIIALLFLAAGAAQSQDGLQQIFAQDGSPQDRFGRSVAISGDTAIVGAYLHDGDNGTDSGAAYVFTKVDGQWDYHATLFADDGAEFERFGISVALSGDTAVVGAIAAATSEGPARGAAYVFKFDSKAEAWLEEAKLIADDGAEFDRFGISVAVSGDTAVIGADNRDNTDGENVESNAGAAYVFTRTGGNWTQDEILTASEGSAGDFFGFSVALPADAAVVGLSDVTTVIGAYGHDANGFLAGAAYVFTRSDGTWEQTEELTASDGAEFDRFGISVALSGDTAMIGADQKESAAREDISGTVYVFTRTEGDWDQPEQETLSPDEGDEAQGFGRGVALSGDTALVGTASENEGPSDAVYFFTRGDNGWNDDPPFRVSVALDDLGPNVALSGDTLVIGAEGLDESEEPVGSVYIPEPNGLALRLVSLASLVALRVLGTAPKRRQRTTA